MQTQSHVTGGWEGWGGGGGLMSACTSLEEVMLLGKAEREEKRLSTEAPASRRCRGRLNSQL